MSREQPRRAFVLVIDAMGAGALPDAADYGDAGADTLGHLAEALGGLRLPVMGDLGLGSIVPIEGVAPSPDPAVHGRLAPLGPGKDSIAGHWELMGVTSAEPLPTYPGGFPARLLARLEAALGTSFLGNRADNGLRAIEEFGAEHLQEGALILYTSQDSVLQLAAHEDRLSREALYDACRRAREVMSGEDGVGRVIARPFAGRPGAFRRTEGRRDFALAPPARSYLDEIAAAGSPVVGVGKIEDLFAGRGLTDSRPGASNAAALAATAELAAELPAGLVFVNLIETDQVYGHRKDVEGFARALGAIDAWLGGLIEQLGEGDLLIVTADHGVDPAHPGTDHTREHAPLLALSGPMRAATAAGRGRGGFRHDGPMADVGATALRWLTGRDAAALPGRAFLS
jgi:phosphopentomutase